MRSLLGLGLGVLFATSGLALGFAASRGAASMLKAADAVATIRSPPPSTNTVEDAARACEDEACRRRHRARWQAEVSELEREAALRAERLRLPFLGFVAPEFRPESVEERIVGWAEGCLRSRAYLNLSCAEYPCVVAFETPRATKCLDELGATRVIEVTGTVTLGEKSIETKPLFVGVFRDPNDVSVLGDRALAAELPVRTRTLEPYLEVAGRPIERLRASGKALFEVRPKRVHIDAFEPAGSPAMRTGNRR